MAWQRSTTSLLPMKKQTNKRFDIVTGPGCEACCQIIICVMKKGNDDTVVFLSFTSASLNSHTHVQYGFSALTHSVLNILLHDFSTQSNRQPGRL